MGSMVLRARLSSYSLTLKVITSWHAVSAAIWATCPMVKRGCGFADGVPGMASRLWA